MAQAAPGGGGADPAPAQPPGMSFLPMALIGIVFLFYMMFLQPQRRKDKRFRDKLAARKKNDRVVTIGGLYGIVANINREADKVTLKVDDQHQTRLHPGRHLPSRLGRRPGTER